MSILRSLQEKAPRELYEAYNKKICDADAIRKRMDSVLKVEQVYDDVDKLLEDVELQLAKSKADYGDCDNTYLFGPRFTVADIDLGLLLFRLQICGLESRFFKNRRPNIQVERL